VKPLLLTEIKSLALGHPGYKKMLTAEITLGALINTGLNIAILGYLINFSRKVAIIETVVKRCRFCNPTEEEINNDPKL
jgi:hypothetical protein